ncbi:hypothetical protein BH11MYX1_BH11MYX1_29360 [soil metagenome]
MSDLFTETDDPATALAAAINALQASEARVERNAERIYDDARTKVVLELLPVRDNRDRTLAVAHVSECASLVEAIHMIRGQLEQVLLHYGVERIDARGTVFDPAIHEAVFGAPVTDPKLVGMVVQQLDPGYRFKSRLLRAAKVSVGVAMEDE